RVCRILTPFRTPIHQLVKNIVVKLPCEARKLSVAVSAWTMTGSTWRHLRIWNSFFVYFFPCGYEFFGRSAQGFRIQTTKMLRECCLHRRVQDMRHTVHIFICPPTLNKGLQLIFYVLGLLSRESRDWGRSMESLPRHAMTCFAIFDLGLKGLRRKASGVCIFCSSRRGKDNNQDCGWQ